MSGASSEMDETEAKKHFDEWKEMLKDRRRPPVSLFSLFILP